MNQKPKDFYVYLHRRLTDGKVFYVGKGTGKRAHEQNKSRNIYWKNIVSKCGYVVEFYAVGLQEWYALELEKELIAYYGRENLCNMTDGGDGLVSPTSETREKIANSVRELMKDESKRKNLSEKTKIHMQCPERRRKIVESSKDFLKNRNPMKNPECVLKISRENNTRSRKVVCIEKNITFLTGIHAEEWLISIGFLKASRSAICNCCRGNYKTAYGFTWKYI